MAERKKMSGGTIAALVILGVIVVGGGVCAIAAGGLGLAVQSELEKAKVDTADFQMRNVADAAELYKIKNNTYPETLDAMITTEPPMLEVVPMDPWNHHYVYSRSGDSFQLKTNGPDGVAGTDDDVTYVP